MRRRAFVGFVASFAALLPFSSQLFADDGTRVTGPIVHANLAIYLVHGANAAGSVPLTLQEALAKGNVNVRETGSVNELTAENVGNYEVFVQAGDIVKGGRQDRVLSVDLLLPPHSGQLSIAAFCVEQGRWAGRSNEDARQFASAAAAMPSHEAKLAMRGYSAAAATAGVSASTAYAEVADVGQSQQEVWKTVKTIQERLGHTLGAPVAAPASPSSLQLSLESEKLKQAQAAYITALQGAGESDGDVIGYVFAINGKINSGDVYASNLLFRKMWRKLLDADVTEAISKTTAAASAAPSVKDVETFLAAAAKGARTERGINDSVRLATVEGDAALFAESQRADGTWIHRNYLAK